MRAMQQCSSMEEHKGHTWVRRTYALESKDVQCWCNGISSGTSDPYQEARLALRDVLGMEPDEQMIRNTMEAHRPQITTMHETAKRVTNVPKPAAPNLTAGFGIAVSGGGFAASATVDTDDTVNGLARLRAHSALDALLDQHGISR